MNQVLRDGKIWVYSQKGEDTAKALGLDERKAGTPASCGEEFLGKYAPAVWVEKGYIVPGEAVNHDYRI